MSQNDYTTAALINRITLKSNTSTSSSLSPQEILDLANDSLRSYLVPLLEELRDEWFISKTDIVLTTASDGSIALPDSVASSLRTVAWNNAGYITPLTRVEPENSFQYLSQQGQLPCGFMLRGYTLFVLPKTPSIEMHISAMFRPAQMVPTTDAAEISSAVGATLVLDSVPAEWQATAPTQVDVISGTSPFQSVGTFDVLSLTVSTKTLVLASAPSFTGEAWVSDVGTSPFASVPIEFYPHLEADVRVELFTALGDKRLPSAEKRRDALEQRLRVAAAPRTQGNSRPIVNPNAPGMRAAWGYWGFGRR